MSRTSIHHLLIVALVVLTSLVHLPAVQATQFPQRNDVVAATQSFAASGHIIHTHGHAHSSTDHSHGAPVAAAGSGPTGNDWVDFGAFPAAVLFSNNAMGQMQAHTALALVIDPANGNFVLANNRSGGGVRVTHVAFQTNYGRPGGPSVVQGNAAWDGYYAGYVPAVQRVPGSDATNTTNCVSYAFNGYVAGAVSQNWVNSGADAAPFENELQVVAAAGLNGNTPTQGGDRCYNDAHVWTLTGLGAATGQLWKNNSSPLYTWAPNPFTNDTPEGALQLYTNYAIGRR